MTTKSHSNDEVIENIVAGVAEYPHGRLALAVDLRDQLRALLAQKDAEIADARREERERCASIVSEKIIELRDSDGNKLDCYEQVLQAFTPPDQTDKSECWHYQAVQERKTVSVDKDGKCITCGVQVFRTDDSPTN